MNGLLESGPAGAVLTQPAPGFRVEPARFDEAEEIVELIRPYAERGLMLPRSLEAVRESIGTHRVVRSPAGEVVGSVGLRAFDPSLVEIIGFAVREDWHGRGVGTELLIRIVDEALLEGFGRVFAMTLRPGPFERLGFNEVERARLPEKIRTDCIGCPWRDGCRERTLLLDVRPFSLLGTVIEPVPTMRFAGVG